MNSNSYSRSRDNSQSLGRPSNISQQPQQQQNIMPANHSNTNSFIKSASGRGHTRTLSGANTQINSTLQKSSNNLDNFEMILDENLQQQQRTAPKFIVSKDSTTAFHTLNDEKVIYSTDERMIFSTVDPQTAIDSHHSSSSGI